MRSAGFVCLLIVLCNRLCAADPLQVVCTVPDLADLVKQVGGDAVHVQALARPGDNPHFVTARPSYIRKVASADAFIVIGMDLEVGWAPALIRSARNNRVKPGSEGYIDCSAAVAALEVPDSHTDRSAGDVHPHGNPHYLLSPRCGLQVMQLLGERLARLDPDRTTIFEKQTQQARNALAEELYGRELVAAFALDDLLEWHEQGKLEEKIGARRPGGWMAAMQSFKGHAFIADHKQWPYLARCYQLNIVAHLEPRPGVPASSKHLQDVIGIAAQNKVKGIVASPWFNPRHVQTVADATGVPVLTLAHQAGALDGTEHYNRLCAHHVARFKALALKK